MRESEPNTLQERLLVSRALRIRTLLKGEILYDNRNAARECVVRDLSETGARVTFRSLVTIPDYVELAIPDKNTVKKARVVRREGYDVGLEFETPPDQGFITQQEKDNAVSERLVALELEVAHLRRLVRRLREHVFVGTPEP